MALLMGLSTSLSYAERKHTHIACTTVAKIALRFIYFTCLNRDFFFFAMKRHHVPAGYHEAQVTFQTTQLCL